MSRRSVIVGVGAGVTALGVFFAGMFVARANPGGEVRRALSFSGTLQGRTGPQSLTFTFAVGSSTACAPSVTTTPDAATGAFSVEIPMDTCPASLFDGSDVTVAVSLGSTVVAAAQPLNPVPYAVYAEHVGTPRCPTGYEPLVDASLPSGAIACRKGVDDVVRVGSGPSAFWIDRYWDSLWGAPDGSGAQLASPAPMANGVFATPTYALSRVGVATIGGITYPQAVALCAQVGKRLPTAAELVQAAQGHPGFDFDWYNNRRPDECPGALVYAYNSGTFPACASRWGVEKMFGYRRHWVESLVIEGTSGALAALTLASHPTYSGNTATGILSRASARDSCSFSGCTAGWSTQSSQGLRCVMTR